MVARQITKRRRKVFLEALAGCGNVSEAMRVAGISSTATVYEVRHTDPEFAKAWEAALDQAADLLEQEARRRAYEGVEEPVFGRVERDRDDKIGSTRRYSDTLLIFLLKGCRPDKYRERREISGPGGGPLRVEYVNDWRGNGNGEASNAAPGTGPGPEGSEAVQRPAGGTALAEDDPRDAHLR